MSSRRCKCGIEEYDVLDASLPTATSKVYIGGTLGRGLFHLLAYFLSYSRHWSAQCGGKRCNVSSPSDSLTPLSHIHISLFLRVSSMTALQEPVCSTINYATKDGFFLQPHARHNP